MDFGVATLTRGRMRHARGLHRGCRGGRAAGLRLHQRQRPRRRAARDRLALSLQRERRVGGAHRRRMPRSARHAGLPAGPHGAPAALDLGDGGAAAPSRADRQDAGDDRRALAGPADRRLRRRLAEGGVRGGRRPAFRRARARHGRVPRRLQGALDRGCPEVLAASTCSFDESIFAPKPVAKPHPPIWIGGESPVALQACGARRRRLVSGIQQPAASPRHRRRGSARRMPSSRRVAEAAGRDPETIDIGYLVLWPVDWTAQKAHRRRTSPVHRAARRTWRPTRRRWRRRACGTWRLTFQTATVAETLERMHRFAAEVMPLVR